MVKESTEGDPPPVHKGGDAPYPLGAPSYLVGPLDLHRPQLQLHIFTFAEKIIREKRFTAFYDMEPPPSPKLSREG